MLSEAYLQRSRHLSRWVYCKDLGVLSSTIYPEGVDQWAQGRSEGIAADRAESARTRWNAAEAEDLAGAVGELYSTGEAAGGGGEEDPAAGGGGDAAGGTDVSNSSQLSR